MVRLIYCATKDEEMHLRMQNRKKGKGTKNFDFSCVYCLQTYPLRLSLVCRYRNMIGETLFARI